MADDRNWERELEKIDKLMSKLPPEEEETPAAQRGRAPASPPSKVEQATPGRLPADVAAPAAAAPATATPAAPSRWARAGVWLLASVATAAAVALPFWPFGSRCGAELLVYLGAVGGAGILGIWTSIRAWRVRAPRAHVIGLLVLLWSLALASWQVLPRVGAALPTPERPAIWSCG